MQNLLPALIINTEIRKGGDHYEKSIEISAEGYGFLCRIF